MNTYADKTQENKSLNNDTIKQNVSESTLQFIDNRSTAVTQQKLQETANNSQQVSSLRSFQNAANNNLDTKKTTQLQSIANTTDQSPIQQKKNNTGLPNNLKSGIEKISGYSMDDVKVHYNSNKPTQLKAHAYAQGTDIHIAPGQEKHLPHEAWHVVQQKQNRVKPTMQLKEKVNVNDDYVLEREADIMGRKSQNLGEQTSQLKSNTSLKNKEISNNAPIQGYFEVGPNRVSENLNIVWEDKKEAYAATSKFTEANQELDGKNGKFLLHKGAGKTYGGNTTFHKVEPRLNPRTTTEEEQNLQPTMGDTDEIIALKHEQYIQELDWVAEDLAEFRVDFPKQLVEHKDWNKENNRKAIIGAALNEWCHAEVFRFDLLFMALAQATFNYLEHGSLLLMTRDIMEVETKFHNFIQKERAYPNAISLPNDCAQCVSEVIGGSNARERGNLNPDIGGNYHETLTSPKKNQTGWNFHWAGVIMKDGGDNITLESAGGMSLTNNDRQTWWFGMFGTKKEEQTFRHQIRQIHYNRNIKLLRKELPDGVENYRFREDFGLILDIVQMQKALRALNGK